MYFVTELNFNISCVAYKNPKIISKVAQNNTNALQSMDGKEIWNLLSEIFYD